MKPLRPKTEAPLRPVLQPGKRGMDLLLSSLLLLPALPVMAVIGVTVRFGLGGPVLFRQERPGWLEQPFMLLKFRTMNEARDTAGRLLPDGQRLTRLGRFLRRTSLDELPGLFNVLRGDLSLVGPRPLLMKYLPYFTAEERVRHAVRPGLTGWAQIHGRNYVPWDQRLALDVWYVQNWSLGLDLRILLRTIWKVLTRDGAAADADTAETDLDQERLGKTAPVGFARR